MSFSNMCDIVQYELYSYPIFWQVSHYPKQITDLSNFDTCNTEKIHCTQIMTRSMLYDVDGTRVPFSQV